MKFKMEETNSFFTRHSLHKNLHQPSYSFTNSLEVHINYINLDRTQQNFHDIHLPTTTNATYTQNLIICPEQITETDITFTNDLRVLNTKQRTEAYLSILSGNTPAIS